LRPADALPGYKYHLNAFVARVPTQTGLGKLTALPQTPRQDLSEPLHGERQRNWKRKEKGVWKTERKEEMG